MNDGSDPVIHRLRPYRINIEVYINWILIALYLKKFNFAHYFGVLHTNVNNIQ